MGVEIADNPQEERYEILVDDAPAGFIQYRIADGSVTMWHTEIFPGHEGEGLGSQLVRVALDDVRARGFKLVPLCNFVARFVREHADEYLDLVPDGRRDKLMAADGR